MHGAERGKIRRLLQRITYRYIRSRNIGFSLIFQNLPQLQNRYPYNQWQEILGDCDTTIFLGCTDPLTAQFISDRTGEVTISVDSKSKMLGTWRVSNYTPEYRETSSVGRRKLLTMDEVLRLPHETELIILRGQKILEARKFDYEKHPDAKKLVKSRATDHVPEWRRQPKPIFQEPLVTEVREEPKGTVALPEKKPKRARRPKRDDTYADNNAEQLSIIPARKEDMLP